MTAVTPVHNGVGIVGFTDNSGAANANMQTYTVITNVNGTPINGFTDFTNALSTVHPNETIPVEAFNPSTGAYTWYSVTLGYDPTSGRPLLGIYALDVSTDYYHPFTNLDRFGGVPGAVLSFISLPFSGRAPVQDPEVRFYQLSGPLAVMPVPLFWLIANALYWLFWLNAMLGATNALPAVPLDGGYIFKDGLAALVTRFRGGLKPEERDRIVRQVTYLFALLILALIVWQMIGPRL